MLRRNAFHHNYDGRPLRGVRDIIPVISMGVRMRINIRAYTVFYVLYLAYVLTTTTAPTCTQLHTAPASTPSPKNYRYQWQSLLLLFFDRPSCRLAPCPSCVEEHWVLAQKIVVHFRTIS